jgi:RpiB/LacA/LacB family sugar-phosphate isomerase
MNIALGSDHAGYRLKEAVKKHLQSQGHRVTDYGTLSEESVDYPDYGFPVARGVAAGQHQRGVLVCGSGQGMTMAANRIKGVRAALCEDAQTARITRQHNDSNVLVLSGWKTEPQLIPEILSVWLTTEFEGGRHLRRIRKLDDLPS